MSARLSRRWVGASRCSRRDQTPAHILQPMQRPIVGLDIIAGARLSVVTRAHRPCGQNTRSCHIPGTGRRPAALGLGDDLRVGECASRVRRSPRSRDRPACEAERAGGRGCMWSRNSPGWRVSRRVAGRRTPMSGSGLGGHRGVMDVDMGTLGHRLAHVFVDAFGGLQPWPTAVGQKVGIDGVAATKVRRVARHLVRNRRPSQALALSSARCR